MINETNSAATPRPVAPAADKKTSLQLRIEAAAAALASREEKLKEYDGEIKAREELARIASRNEEIDLEERQLSLDRRLDAAQELLGDGVKLAQVMIKSSKDDFIVRANPVAYKAFDKTLNDSGNRKIDPQEERRKLVSASVVDWNGETDFGPTGLAGARLTLHLTHNMGIVAPLINQILELNGVLREERKSRS